jgi:competence protein ComGC
MRRLPGVLQVVIAWAVLATAVWAADAPPAVRPLFLHLDEESLVERAAPDEPLVQVDEQELRDLIDRYESGARAKAAAEAPRAPAPPPAPRLPAVVRRVEAEAVPGADTLAVTATFHVGAGALAGQSVRLLPAGVAVLDFTGAHAGDRLRVSEDGKWLAYVPARDGAARVQLVFASAIVADRSRRSVSVPLPGAAEQEVRVTFPPPAASVSVEPAVLPARTERTEGGQRVIVPAGGQSAVWLAWMTHAPRPAPSVAPVATVPRSNAPAGPRLFVNVSTLHSIGDGIARFHAWIDLVNSRDRVGHVDLAVPLKVAVPQVAGPLVKSFEVSPQGDGKRVRVMFSEGFRGRTRIELDGEVAIPTDGTARLPLVAVPGAVRVHGVVGVSVFATYGVEPAPAESTDVSVIDVSELPVEVTQASPSPVLRAFRCNSGKSALAIHLSRFKPHPRLSTAIEGINAVTVLSPAQAAADAPPGTLPRLRTYTRLVMKVANAGQQDLRFTLPDDARIESCFVDLVPQTPARLPGKDGLTTYLIPLKLSTVAANRLVPFPVEVAYRQDVDRAAGVIEHAKIPFPQLSAPATDTTWTVYTPDGQRMVSVGGGFHEVATAVELLLVAHGHMIFELVIYRGGRFAVLLMFLFGVPFLLFQLWLRRARGAALGQAGAPKPSSIVVSMGISAAIVVILASIAVPNFKAARERSNTRACYANQKTIVGAVEMFNLDKNMKRTTLDKRFFEDLREGGYLQSIPNDPGTGVNTEDHYHATDSGNGIACKVHGGIQ